MKRRSFLKFIPLAAIAAYLPAPIARAARAIAPRLFASSGYASIKGFSVYGQRGWYTFDLREPLLLMPEDELSVSFDGDVVTLAAGEKRTLLKVAVREADKATLAADRDNALYCLTFEKGKEPVSIPYERPSGA